MHLADAFIQSNNLQCIQVIHFFCQYMCSLGIEPTTFALLTQCSTTEPQEHMYCSLIVFVLFVLSRSSYFLLFHHPLSRMLHVSWTQDDF